MSSKHRVDLPVHYQDYESSKFGHLFCATMQLRVPLRVLLRHGEFCPAGTVPPVIADEAWQGIWVPHYDGKMMPGTMASEVGYIPNDGGDYLKFLIEVRSVVEADSSIEARRAALRSALGNPAFEDFIAKLGGLDRVVSRLMLGSEHRPK